MVISSSRLPRSRSRTTAVEVNTIIVIVRITPHNAGTICTAVRFSGLYAVRISTGRTAAGAPARFSSGIAASPAATFSRPGWLPSTMICSAGRPPSARRRSRSGGMTIATFDSPCCISPRSWRSVPAFRIVPSTCVAPRSPTSRRESEVRDWSSTAVETPRTSKLIA